MGNIYLLALYKDIYSLNKQFSVYLDAIRIVAAFVVFIGHLTNFIGGWLWQLGGLGHEAVILFFVLSGYVISYVVDTKEKSLFEYSMSRFARIYSVAIPAIILTIILYNLGNYINPESFSSLTPHRIQDPFITFFSAIFFVNQSWQDLTFFSNMPYWSLGYEVLYYVFFGILTFVTGKKRIPLLILIALVMGPSVLLYFPIWLIGVLTYNLTKNIAISRLNAYFLFVFSIAVIVVLCIPFIQNTINDFVFSFTNKELISLLNETAMNFGSDYLLAIGVSLNMLAFYFISNNVIIFHNRVENFIRLSASYTFSLYLYHMPILFFISAIAPFSENPIFNILGSTLLTIIFIIVLGNYTERKKYIFKNLFYTAFKYKS